MAVSPYGSAIMEHFRRPRNYGPLPNASAEAEGANPLCGDRVRVALVLNAAGERIAAARFTANACAICVAAASLLTERLTGASRDEIDALSEEHILAMLGGGISEGRRKCATLPLEAVRRAVAAANWTSSRPAPPHIRSVVGVVLAAGGARRYGGDQKLVAEVPDAEGRRASLVRVAIGQLRRAGLCDVLAVVGHEEERVRSRLEGLGVEIVSNPAHANGMSTSVKAGVRAALERGPQTAGILIALGDQPLLDEQIVPRLVDAFESSAGARIVAPRYRGVRGNPVVFSRELADELLAIDGDHGARAVIDRDPARVLTVDFESAAPLDVDTPDDLLRFSGMFDEYQRSH